MSSTGDNSAASNSRQMNKKNSDNNRSKCLNYRNKINQV